MFHGSYPSGFHIKPQMLTVELSIQRRKVTGLLHNTAIRKKAAYDWDMWTTEFHTCDLKFSCSFWGLIFDCMHSSMFTDQVTQFPLNKKPRIDATHIKWKVQFTIRCKNYKLIDNHLGLYRHTKLVNQRKENHICIFVCNFKNEYMCVKFSNFLELDVSHTNASR